MKLKKERESDLRIACNGEKRACKGISFKSVNDNLQRESKGFHWTSIISIFLSPPLSGLTLSLSDLSIPISLKDLWNYVSVLGTVYCSTCAQLCDTCSTFSLQERR